QHPDPHSFPTRRSSDLIPRLIDHIDDSISFSFRAVKIDEILIIAPEVEEIDFTVCLKSGNIDPVIVLRQRDAAHIMATQTNLARSEEHTSELQSRENLV